MVLLLSQCLMTVDWVFVSRVLMLRFNSLDFPEMMYVRMCLCLKQTHSIIQSLNTDKTQRKNKSY